MLILNYLIFKNNYVVPNFNYGMLCYVTISTSAAYVFMIGLMGEKLLLLLLLLLQHK